jgi:hypothetical protein
VCLRMLSHSVRITHIEFEPSPSGRAIPCFGIAHGLVLLLARLAAVPVPTA